MPIVFLILSLLSFLVWNNPALGVLFLILMLLSGSSRHG